MALPFYNWSQTKSDNATADSGVNWAEGQAPSSVNDSARAMMASIAAWRDDISKATVSGGTGTAYTLATSQIFDTLAHMDRAMVTFIPILTNTGAVTLNVDSLGVKPLRPGTGVDFPAGTLIGGTPYTATYFNSNSEWYVHGVVGDPTTIPIGACVPYFGATAPNSNFAIPLGQAISRTTYATLFALFGTTHGVGDGSTTFNLPDMGGRSFFGKEATATRLTTAGGGLDGGTLGAVGGQQNRTLLTANLPSYTPAGSFVGATPNTKPILWSTSSIQSAQGGGNVASPGPAGDGSVHLEASLAVTGTFTGTAQGGTSTAIQALPPGIVGNWIMRVL